MAKAWRKIGGKNKLVRRLGIMADQAFRVNPRRQRPHGLAAA